MRIAFTNVFKMAAAVKTTSSTTSVKTTVSTGFTNEPATKKRAQCYRESYTEKYSFIKPGSIDTRVLCTVCASEFGCKYGGMDDIR